MMWVEKCDNKKIGKVRARRRGVQLSFISLGLFAAVFLFTFLVQRFGNLGKRVEAASLADFDAGYIISDYQMSNYGSMSENEIQEFLTKKNPCNNTNYNSYVTLTNNYPNIKWHFENGHFVCLSEELFGDGEEIGKGDTAAHIIWQAAQDYKINPQVLIVLLQKEQGLITDDFPNSRQYRSATGYGCPDTAACSSAYYGFKNQVRRAAAMFRTVLDGGWTNYPVGNNYIQYNPSASCGGSMVNIKNLATSALYRYTPYQPNVAALSVGYGTAQCGAYGNRNFYLYFEDWFSGIKNEGVVASSKTDYIEEGVYQLRPKAYDGKVIDIKGGIYDGMASGDTMLFGNKKNVDATTNQVFRIQLNTDTGNYKIINPATGLALDVKGGYKENSTPVIVWKTNSGCNQDWIFSEGKDGFYTITSSCSGKVLDGTSDGRVIIFSEHGGDNQKWQLVPVQTPENMIENGVYQISMKDNLAIDIRGGVFEGMQSGDVVAFNKKKLDSESIDNQLFKIEFKPETQTYRIYNYLTGLYLTSGTNVTVGQTNSCLTEWIIYKKIKGEYKIFSSCSGAIGVSESVLGSSKRLTTDGTGEEWSFNKYDTGEGEQFGVLENKKYQLIMGNNAIDIFDGIVDNMKIGKLIAFPAKQKNLENQTFSVKYNISTDDYFIYNPSTKLYLDVEEARTANDSRVILFSYNGNCNQRWKIAKKGGGYELSSVCSNKKLTVSGKVKTGIYDSLTINDSGTIWIFKEV